MIQERIAELVEEAVANTSAEPIEGGLPPGAFLPDYLDSVVLSALLVLIEDEWDLEISDEEIEPELFESLDALAGFVRMKTSS